MSNNQKPNQASQHAEPREFWIYDVWDPVTAKRFCLDSRLSNTHGGADEFHVIDYSAYQALQEKLKIAIEALKTTGGYLAGRGEPDNAAIEAIRKIEGRG